MASQRLLPGLIAVMLALPAAAVEPVKPKEPGMRAKPGKEIDVPKDRGMVVTPPKVNDEAVKTPPKNIDPKIDDATKRIDEANRAEHPESGKRRQQK